jgi:serine/threonine-protein kinase
MPPEQALGKSDAIDARSDLWSVGATLFTLLGGEYVHGNGSAMQTVISAATNPARSIVSLLPDLDAGVVAVVDRALAFEQNDRWPDAAAMRSALLEATRRAFGSVASPSTIAAWLEEDSPTQVSPLDALGSAERSAPQPVPVSDIAAESHPVVESTLPGPEHAHVSVQAVSEKLVRADTTARPVSSVPSADPQAAVRPPVASRFGRWVFIAAACAAVSVGALVIRGRLVSGPPAAAVVNAMTTSPSLPLPPPSDPLPVPSPTPALPVAASSEPSPPPTVQSVATVNPPSPQPTKPLPVAQPTPRASAPPRSAAVKPVTSAAARPGCDPNFTIDADGAKHFKPECFR